MPSNGPPRDDDRDHQDPPIRSPYAPMGPQALPWRSWIQWLFRGLSRSFASVGPVGFAWLGRGLEVAAAGVLIAGVAITWHFGAPPFAGASDKNGSCEHHHCCHSPAGQPAAGLAAQTAPSPSAATECGQVAGDGASLVDRQLEPGEKGEPAAASTPCTTVSSTGP